MISQQPSQMNNIGSKTSAVNMSRHKTINKPQNQSFYDDGLLDLIEEMNP